MKLCECGCGQPAPISDRNDTRRGYIKDEPMRRVHGHAWRQGVEAGDPELVVDASVAQAVEQGTCNAQVGGSNPSAGSKFDLATYFENIARREDA